MDDREIKLRLVEAAAQMPVARQHLDPEKVKGVVHSLANAWYNNFVNARTGTPEPSAPGGKRK